MQSYPPCAPNVEDDTFDDETTHARVRRLEEQLTERIRASPIPYVRLSITYQAGMADAFGRV